MAKTVLTFPKALFTVIAIFEKPYYLCIYGKFHQNLKLACQPFWKFYYASRTHSKNLKKKNQVGLENLHQLTTSLYYRLNIRDSPNIPSYGRSRNNRYPYTTRKLDLFHNCFSGGHSYHYTEIHSLYGHFSSCESAMLWRGVSLILVTK